MIDQSLIEAFQVLAVDEPSISRMTREKMPVINDSAVDLPLNQGFLHSCVASLTTHAAASRDLEAETTS